VDYFLKNKKVFFIAKYNHFFGRLTRFHVEHFMECKTQKALLSIRITIRNHETLIHDSKLKKLLKRIIHP